jgi:hypothetical protein
MTWPQAFALVGTAGCSLGTIAIAMILSSVTHFEYKRPTRKPKETDPSGD